MAAPAPHTFRAPRPSSEVMTAPILRDVRADVAYGWRVLKRSPGLAAMAVMTLALGIGANVTVFTLANAFLFKNLPFADSARILYVSGTLLTRSGKRAIAVVPGLPGAPGSDQSVRWPGGIHEPVGGSQRQEGVP